MLIKDIDSFLKLYWNDENKISHLDEIINKNKNVLINDSHKNIKEKKFHIIHENTASIMLKRKQELKSILIMLMKKLESSTNVTITNKMTDYSMHVWLSVCFENEFETLLTIWMTVSDVIIS